MVGRLMENKESVHMQEETMPEKVKIKPTGEPTPYIMFCTRCQRHSLFPENVIIDFEKPPLGWKCCYCGNKYYMKFNKNQHKWEYTEVRDEA